MRKIVTAAFVSLDGVMQAPGGPSEDTSHGFEHGGWLAPLWDDALEEAIGELFAARFDLLLGRKTYDIFAAFWPGVAKKSAGEVGEGDLLIAKRFDAATKYVATHHAETLGWQNSRSLGSDVVATLRELKRQDGPTLITQGSSVLVHTLLANDLIDELHLMTFPIVLGRGKRLFADDARAAAFEVTRTVVSPRGAMLATYRRSGPVTTGSMLSPPERSK
jgi:dihydrofolate reductase